MRILIRSFYCVSVQCILPIHRGQRKPDVRERERENYEVLLSTFIVDNNTTE